MLPPPNATYSEDLYRFHWPDFGVEVIVEAFVQRKEDIAAETIITMQGGRLYSGRLLLIGPNSRRDVRKELEQRTEEIDWGGMLEQVCLLSRERFRRGEPVIRLSDVVPEGQQRFLHDRYILDRALSILYGDGATAKSSLALRWAIAVSLEHGPVLYLDWEDDAATHAERLMAICTGLRMDMGKPEIYYQRRAARLSDSVREVRRLIAEKGIVLVIVDSLGMAAGDPNNHDLMIEAVRGCRALGVAVLAIHHLPKNSMDKSKPFGSVYASNEARLTWLVEKEQEEDSPEFNVLLTNHKSNRSRKYAKRALRICYENTQDDQLLELRITAEDASNVEAFRPKIALYKHIIAVLRRPMPTAEIVKALKEDGRETTDSAVRRAISERKGMFVNIGSANAAIWGIAEYQRTEAHATARGAAR